MSEDHASLLIAPACFAETTKYSKSSKNTELQAILLCYGRICAPSRLMYLKKIGWTMQIVFCWIPQVSY